MSFDPSIFPSTLVADTCSVWNMLSSNKLSQASIQARLHFCITPAVLYECLHKPRASITTQKQEMMNRLTRARLAGRFPVQQCSIEDLIAISEKAPGRLGAGELSCMATAYRIRSIAFMTDELLAGKYAKTHLQLPTETTPRLYGYLHYHRHLGDSDHADVIMEHESFESRPLSKYLNDAFQLAMKCRLMNQQSNAL